MTMFVRKPVGIVLCVVWHMVMIRGTERLSLTRVLVRLSTSPPFTALGQALILLATLSRSTFGLPNTDSSFALARVR